MEAKVPLSSTKENILPTTAIGGGKTIGHLPGPTQSIVALLSIFVDHSRI